MNELKQKIINIISLQQKHVDAMNEFCAAIEELKAICPHERIVEYYTFPSPFTDERWARMCATCKEICYHDNYHHKFYYLPQSKMEEVSYEEFCNLQEKYIGGIKYERY